MYNGFLLSIFTRTLSSVFSEAEICGELKFNLNSFLSELIVPLSFVLDPIETFGKSTSTILLLIEKSKFKNCPRSTLLGL